MSVAAMIGFFIIIIMRIVSIIRFELLLNYFLVLPSPI